MKGKTFKNILTAVGIFVILLLAATLIVTFFGQSSPVYEDAHHHLVYKPGRTVPARSLDFTGNGRNFHITRFNSYRTPDWKPRSN